MRGKGGRLREHRAADDLIDADRRQVPASELAPQQWRWRPALRAGSLRPLA